jgi:hypothetical protein
VKISFFVLLLLLLPFFSLMIQKRYENSGEEIFFLSLAYKKGSPQTIKQQLNFDDEA